MRRLPFAFLLATGLFAQNEPEMPLGLWQNKEEGFVLRIERCGRGFCGFAAGAPRERKKGKEAAACGAQMLKEFRWSERNSRWEGRMQPPGTSASMSASILSDGRTFLRMKGQMLFISKAMSMAPFTGKIGANCQVE